MSYTNGLDKPTDYFNTVLYTGNGSNRTITGVGFQPDWVWVKNRTVARPHRLADSVRGDAKILVSNDTIAEYTDTTQISGFDSDGFDVGTGTAVNESSQSFVAWNWLASNTTASNTDGSITSTVSANQTAGFSIGTYNGSGSDNTVGHGLNSTPSMIIVKCKSTAHDWVVYHSALGSGKILTLNATTASQSATGWQNTDPTSTVFSIDNAANSLNQSGQSFVFYAMASKKGYSKAFSFVGNASTNGSFCFLGFKPAFVILKNASATGNWWMFDNKRNPHNVTGSRLQPNSSNAESTYTDTIDFLSQGIKLRGTYGDINGSGNTIVGIAFAESPFVTSTGIPTTAR